MALGKTRMAKNIEDDRTQSRRGKSTKLWLTNSKRPLQSKKKFNMTPPILFACHGEGGCGTIASGSLERTSYLFPYLI